MTPVLGLSPPSRDSFKTVKWFSMEIAGFLREVRFKASIFYDFLLLYYQWLFLIITGVINWALIGARYCDKCFMNIISFNPYTTLWVFYPHFTDEKTLA